MLYQFIRILVLDSLLDYDLSAHWFLTHITLSNRVLLPTADFKSNQNVAGCSSDFTSY